MNRIIIGIFLTAYALNGYTKDSTFSCVGTVEEDFTFQSGKTHYEVADKIGLIVKDKRIILVGSQNLEIPIQYEKNGKSFFDYDFTFPICTNKNYEIFANNYSCDFNVISNAEKNLPNKMADNYEIKFNGLTNVLIVSVVPTTEKRMQRDEKKSSYKMQHASYQCKASSSSF